jgi:hypothetical protein
MGASEMETRNKGERANAGEIRKLKMNEKKEG